MHMNKTIIMLGMGVGSTIGAVVPLMWGDANLMGGASIIWGLVGGVIGIWLGAKVSKAMS